jgi:glycine/D-amino acid oxidase-like deaminating enzyme
MDYPHVVIGGGVYGCYVALQLAQRCGGEAVAIVEREADLLRCASYNNQARVHTGYHYPRSILTGLRSRINAPRFMAEFGDAIFSDFEQYYAIARGRSNVTAGQFEQFCRRIGAPLRPAPARVAALFDDDLIEAVYAVTEMVFDADRLRDRLRERIEARGIRLFLETEAQRISPPKLWHGDELEVELTDRRSKQSDTLRCRLVYNCTYSRLNQVLARSGLTPIRLRHEATEMALVELPPALRHLSVTVMCGPFFSLMPFPAQGLATLSHVSYTPHYAWAEEPGAPKHVGHRPAFPLPSHFDRMWRDAARYLPALRQARHAGSLWEVKTILPQSDVSDSRPILFKRDAELPGVISLLGGKIDNIYDLDDVLAAVLSDEPASLPAPAI